MTYRHDDHRPGARPLFKVRLSLILIVALIAFQREGAVSLAQAPVRDPRPGVEEPTGTSSLSGSVIDSDTNPLRRQSSMLR